MPIPVTYTTCHLFKVKPLAATKDEYERKIPEQVFVWWISEAHHPLL
jgi:hypothetical protein